MISKMIFAAAAIASTAMLAVAPAAKADSIGFGITLGDGGWGGGYPGGGDWRWRHPHPRPHYWGGGFGGDFDGDYSPPPVRYGMSCNEGAGLLRNSGFRGVHATDCSRPVYEYEAWKRGRLFSVDVSVAGRIVSVDPVY
ncbi:hypothetical protein [Aestuariivirga litoralis]|uniref:hypothetical protein n=1 Tax=Aestuariivirga litoralis TaxID=2650924 RepID=UPI0018C84932|nr:hypothetical protein [Aestuariivirga litoralis]MBG1233612.1 hypothetical protein [Aestuariivirga litoralis]